MLKPVIVMVTSRFPWPLTNGFAIKNYWLLRALSREYRVRLHVVGRFQSNATAMAEVMQFCETVSVHRPDLVETAIALFRALFYGTPAQLALFHSRSGLAMIRRDLKDAVAAISSAARTAPYILKFDGPVFMDLADSLGQAYARNALQMTSVLKKALYREEGRRMLRYEQFLVARSQGTFFFNQSEANLFDGLGPLRVVPHGVNPRLFEISNTDAKFGDGVALFGKMDYEPNVNAVLWFAENVLPLLPKDLKLYVIGFQPARRIRALAVSEPRVVVVGFMDDPYPALRGAIASICPLQMGGGIQNKVIESLAVGAYTIISPLAARPLSEIELSGIVVCDDPTEWVGAIISAKEDAHRNVAARVAGREYARKRFSWGAYGDEVLDQIQIGLKRRQLGTINYV